jgi:hypothetical protein
LLPRSGHCSSNGGRVSGHDPLSYRHAEFVQIRAQAPAWDMISPIRPGRMTVGAKPGIRTPYFLKFFWRCCAACVEALAFERPAAAARGAQLTA